MNPEVELLQALVKTFGSLGTMVILVGGVVIYYLKHRSGASPVKQEKHERQKARETILVIEANLNRLMKDVDEIKRDAKADSVTLTSHLRYHG